MRIAIDDPATNRATLIEAVEAAAQSAQVIVLPELALCGSAFVDAAEATSRAESADGTTVALLQDLSRRHSVVIVGGFCLESGGDRPYNAAVLVDRGEVMTIYRKTHLWGTEKVLFTPGDQPPPVVSTSVGRIAVMICYDAEFPEVVRDASLAGAQLMAIPANWPEYPRPLGPAVPEVIKAQANASFNRVFVTVADRCGGERGIEWIGASLICGPDGYLVAGPAAGESTILYADLDLAQALDKRIGPYNDAFSDRRPELYH